MKKVYNSFFILILTIILTVEVIINSNEVIDSVQFSFNIWKNNIFPSLFPFFVVSNLLVNYGFIEIIGEIFKPIMGKVFKSSGDTAFVFILSMLSGFPSSSKYTKDLYDENVINDEEASKLLTFTHFPNPLFVIGSISLLFLNDKYIGYFILLSIFLSNIIIGFIFRNYYISDTNTKISFKDAYKKIKIRYKNNKSFGTILTKTLTDSINLLLLILGTISLFLIINKILTNMFNLNDFSRALLSSTFEMTGGLKYISLLNIDKNFKAILSTMVLAFGGLSVHTQTLSIISDTKIKYLPFLLARIMHVFISGGIMYLFLLF